MNPTGDLLQYGGPMMESRIRLNCGSSPILGSDYATKEDSLELTRHIDVEVVPSDVSSREGRSHVRVLLLMLIRCCPSLDCSMHISVFNWDI